MEGYPIKLVLGPVDGKWKLRVLWELSQQEVIRFNELQRRPEGTSNAMPPRSLEGLERARLAHREQYPKIPPRVEYSLTTLGRFIDPYLCALDGWGTQACEAIQAG